MNIEEIKRLRKEAEAELAKQIADEPDSPTQKLNIDNLQHTFERTWEAIENSGTVKDLTNLTTQKEISDSSEQSGAYLIKDPTSGISGIFICNMSDSVLTIFSGIAGDKIGSLKLASINANSGSPSNIAIEIKGNITTEKYVDDKVTAIEYDTKLYSFTADAHTLTPDSGWEFVAITEAQVLYDTNYKYVASDVGATSTSGSFKFHGATPNDGVYDYAFDKDAQTVTITKAANFNALGTGGIIRMLIRKI